MEAYKKGFTTYSSGRRDTFITAIGFTVYKRKRGLDYAPGEILIAAGGRPLIYALYRHWLIRVIK